MARRKRTSPILDAARHRLAGLKQINPKPNFGSALTVEAYEAAVNGYGAEEDSYNGDIAALDDRTNQLDELEQTLSDFNQRVLAAVKAQYGPDSSEVELVGGIRRRDRKKPTRRAQSTAAPVSKQ